MDAIEPLAKIIRKLLLELKLFIGIDKTNLSQVISRIGENERRHSLSALLIPIDQKIPTSTCCLLAPFSKMIFTIFQFISIINLLGVVESQDKFNYGSTQGRDYGPRDWDEVSCNNLDTCPGWPDKLEGSVGWELSRNTCKHCPIEGNSCGQHRQSPIDLYRDRAIPGHRNEKECPDWHW